MFNNRLKLKKVLVKTSENLITNYLHTCYTGVKSSQPTDFGKTIINEAIIDKITKLPKTSNHTFHFKVFLNKGAESLLF